MSKQSTSSSHNSNTAVGGSTLEECQFEKTVREFFGWSVSEAINQEVEADFTCLTNLVCFAYENLTQQPQNIGDLYAEALFDFCKFICNEGYHINGYDDMQLATVIKRFLDKDKLELCEYCGYLLPNHEERCKIYKSNIK